MRLKKKKSRLDYQSQSDMPNLYYDEGGVNSDPKKKKKDVTLYEKKRYKKDATDEQKYSGKDTGVLSVKSKKPGKAGSGKVRTFKITLRGKNKKPRRKIELPTLISKMKRENLFKKKKGRVRGSGLRGPRNPGVAFKLGLTKISKACRRFVKSKN